MADPDNSAGFGLLLFYSFPDSGGAEVGVGRPSLNSELGSKEKGVVSIFIIGVQLILVFMYKFYFFDL